MFNRSYGYTFAASGPFPLDDVRFSKVEPIWGDTMNRQQRAEMYIKGYRFQIRETDASHIGVGEPICVKTIGESTLYRASAIGGIFEINDLNSDGSTTPLSTIQNLHQRKGASAKAPRTFNPEFRWPKCPAQSTQEKPNHDTLNATRSTVLWYRC